MSAIPVDVQRIEPGQGPRSLTPASEMEADLERVRKLASVMDAKFEIAGIRLGWDAIIGLVPVVGDVVTGAIGVYPLHIARKHRLSGWTQARMAGNLLLDWGIGAIPLLGDVFDVAFKANMKNLRLLERAIEKKQR